MPQRIQKSNFTLIFNLKRNPAKLQSCAGASFSHFLLELFYLKPRQLYVAISLSSWKYSWPNPIISFFHFSSFAIRNTIILGDSNFQEWLLSPYRSIYLFMWSQLLLISLPISFNKTSATENLSSSRYSLKILYILFSLFLLIPSTI